MAGGHHDNQPTWARARELSYASGSAGREELAGLAEAIGRSLARDVVADFDLPHYVSAAMDGWAVSGAQPWVIVESDVLHPGECRAIVTGAGVPEGATAVLRSEHAARSSRGGADYISTTEAARADEPRDGEHIRPVGTEARAGDILIRRGTRLNPAHVALAASGGRDELAVFARPRIRVVVTGDEVVGDGAPSSGRVRDSFTPTLPWLVSSLGGVVVSAGRAADSKDELVSAFSTSPGDHDIIVSTGGTGGSDADHLHEVIAELGGVLLVDGIRMRPGHPSVLARFPDGRLLVGLPGNPLAAMLGLMTLGAPLIAAMTGAGESRTEPISVGVDISGRPNVSLLVPYQLENGAAVPSSWTGSGMMRGLAASVGVLICPPDGICRGGDADSFSLPWAGWASPAS